MWNRKAGVRTFGLIRILVCLPVFFVSFTAAHAGTSERDLQVAVRAVRFMASPPSGSVPTYIVFDPGNAASSADADAIVGFLGSGLKAGSATLVPQKVAFGDLAGASGGGGVVIVASDSAGAYQAVTSAAASNKLLTVSSDLGCVRGGGCIVGVTSEPKVQIIVNNDAASSASVEFKSAFMMLVEQM